MKRRVLSVLLAFALLLSAAPAARAAGAFSDVADGETARNVEVLRLMGVVEGDGNGTFRPGGSLTRAEFCKMTLVLQNRAERAAGYRTRTVFPDVRASHWAAGYVNLATEKSDKSAQLMHGFPDGTFRPDKTISYGEAVTVLMRALGYSDADTGGIWPDGYLALAGEAGMAKGLSLGGDAAITRAQAAKLFVNALTAKNDGTTLLEKLGYTAALSEEPVTLYSVDLVNGELRTSDGSVKLAKATASTVLNGLKGYVVKRGGEAVTFLPASESGVSVPSDAAIIVAADGSTAGLDALTGGVKNYAVYRNGARASVGSLKKYDVVTYNAAANALQACDTRVTAYYEACDPSPSAPVTITTLGGTKLHVLTTARSSLARFKPGQQLVLQLTAEGQVAGAVESGTSGAQSNALAFVAADGKGYLICGSGLVQLALNGVEIASMAGYVVNISQNDVVSTGEDTSKKGVYLSKQSSNAAGVLDLTSRTLGGRRLASDVLVFSDGAQTSLEGLGVTRLDPNRIAYARVNGAGEVDMLVIAETTGNIYYGRAKVEPVRDENGSTVVARDITINGNGHDSPKIRTGYVVSDEAFVEGRVNSAGTEFLELTALTKFANVPASAWVGDRAVNFAGSTYSVDPDTVLCWNGDSETWFTATSSAETALDAARAYGGTMDLYVKDGVVRVIEARA